MYVCDCKESGNGVGGTMGSTQFMAVHGSSWMRIWLGFVCGLMYVHAVKVMFPSHSAIVLRIGIFAVLLVLILILSIAPMFCTISAVAPLTS